MPLPGFTAVTGCPLPIPAPQLCLWQISVPLGHVIDLHFHNFSLESQEDCSFDFVEVHDSAGTGTASLMGRYPSPPGPLCHPAHTAHLGKLRHGGLRGRSHHKAGFGEVLLSPLSPSLVHDLGRFCGHQLPPTLTSSRHVMTVLFVADEGVADDGFFATYQARNATESR